MNSPQRLQEAFRKGLALPAAYDVTHAELAGVKQWDSVAHLQLVIAIEDEFQVRLDSTDVIDLKSYPSAVGILQRLGAWQDA